MSERYKVVKGSGHECCFHARVVDTQQPIMIGGEHYNGDYETVCETFDEATASIICDAMNKTGSHVEPYDTESGIPI